MGRNALHNAHYLRRASPQVPLPLQSQSPSQRSDQDPFFAVDEMEIEASDPRTEDLVQRVGNGGNPFSSSTLQPFHTLSERAVDAALAFSRHPREEKEWKLVKEHADIRVLRSARRRGKTTTMLATGSVQGTLSETLDGLYAETTKEARVLYALLSDKFVDAAVLHVDSYRTAQHPHQFAGVTWMALETPRGGGYGVCKARDFLCFTKMGTFKDPESGDDVGFLTLQSLDQTEASTRTWLRSSVNLYASAVASSDLVRGFLSVTAFFRPSPLPGSLSFFVSADFNARGHLTTRLGDLLFAELVFALGNAAQSGQAKSLAMLLQSISAGQQLPVGGSSQRYHHLLPLLSEKNRDKCAVCAKTLWKMLERPEYCRSCWARTCRRCHVTRPVYCADFHRAHDDEGGGGGSILTLRGRRHLPKPCKETFCLACVCSVLPHGVAMRGKLLQRTAKKKRLQRKKNKWNRKQSSVGAPGSSVQRGGRVAPSVVLSTGSRTTGSRARSRTKARSRGTGSQASGSTGTRNRRRRQKGEVIVQLPTRPLHQRRLRSVTPSQYDDGLSISVLSSVESEKLQRQRLSLTSRPPPPPPPPAAAAATAQQRPQYKHEIPGLPKPTSMLEVLENFQLSHMTATSSMDLLDQFPTLEDDFLDQPPRSPPPPPPPLSPQHRLQLHVNVHSTRRHRSSSSSSSSSSHLPPVSSPSTTSRRTNAASSYKQSPNAKPRAFNDEYYRRALQRYLDKRRTSVGVASTSTRSLDRDELEEDEFAGGSRGSSPPPPPLRRPIPRRASTGTPQPSFHFDNSPPSSSFSSRSSASIDQIATKYRPSDSGSGGWAPPAY